MLFLLLLQTYGATVVEIKPGPRLNLVLGPNGEGGLTIKQGVWGGEGARVFPAAPSLTNTAAVTVTAGMLWGARYEQWQQQHWL